MTVVVNADYIPDLDNPTNKLIAYCIKQHQKEIERLDKLNDVYLGKHEIDDRKRESELAPNTKVTVNHAKYITDMVVGFTFGNPIKYTPGVVDSEGGEATKVKSKNIDPIINDFKRLDISAHDAELGKDLSVGGQGIEVVYAKKVGEDKTEPAIKTIDPRGAFVVTDDTLEKNYLFGVHYMEKFDLEGNSEGWEVDIYGKNFFIEKRTDSLDMPEDGTLEWDRRANPFKDVQLTDFRNNEEKQGDFEQQIPLINAYNNLQSDRVSDKQAFIDAILIFYGFKLAEGQVVGQDSLLEAPAKSGQDGGAAAEYLTKVLDENATQVLAQSLIDDIHKTSYVPNMNDKEFAGNVSGIAMKFKLFSLLQLMTVKERYYLKGLRRRLQLLQNYYTLKNVECDVSGVDIAMTPNIPVNTAEVLEMVVAAKDILSLETLLQLVPFIDDPEQEVEKLIEQKKKDIELNRQAFGEESMNRPTEPPEDDNEEDEEE